MPAEQRYKLDNGEEVVCLDIVRSLPGKRIVFLGEYAGKKVFVKLYLDKKRGDRHWRRELDGLNAFNDCNILTADLLHAGKTVDKSLPVIVLAQLKGKKSIKQAWAEADDQAREQILKRMTILLAGHHQAGICQTDLHLDNFMLSGHEIFSLDGAGVKVIAGEIGPDKGLANLGLLIAQLPPVWESRASEVYDLYAAERGWQHGPGSESLLEEVQDAREGRWKEFRNKLFRNCTAFSYINRRDGFQVVANEYARCELFDLLRNPDASFSNEGQALKNGNTCTVWATGVDDLCLVIKRYNVKDIWHGLKLLMFPGRGERSWVNGYCLDFFGIPTPRPVALLKWRVGVFPTTYLLTEWIKAISAKKWFRDPAVSTEDKGLMAEQIVKMLHNMQQQRISHGDLKASNILITEGKPMLIDLDAMCRHKSSFRFRRARARDIQRFLKNWEYDKELLGLFMKSLKSSGIDPV